MIEDLLRPNRKGFLVNSKASSQNLETVGHGAFLTVLKSSPSTLLRQPKVENQRLWRRGHSIQNSSSRLSVHKRSVLILYILFCGANLVRGRPQIT